MEAESAVCPSSRRAQVRRFFAPLKHKAALVNKAKLVEEDDPSRFHESLPLISLIMANGPAPYLLHTGKEINGARWRHTDQRPGGARAQER